MSLIADSLRKAIKENTIRSVDSGSEINLMGDRDQVVRSRFKAILRVVLLMAVLLAFSLYFIFPGAFDFKKPLAAEKPDWRERSPLDRLKIPFDSGVSPKGSKEEFFIQLEQKLLMKETATGTAAVPPSSPEMKPDEEAITERTLVKIPGIPPNPFPPSPLREKRETVHEKVLPPYPSKKRAWKSPVL